MRIDYGGSEAYPTQSMTLKIRSSVKLTGRTAMQLRSFSAKKGHGIHHQYFLETLQSNILNTPSKPPPVSKCSETTKAPPGTTKDPSWRQLTESVAIPRGVKCSSSGSRGCSYRQRRHLQRRKRIHQQPETPSPRPAKPAQCSRSTKTSP